ncbi:DUF1080 domain-containing protein [Robiginitalea sp. SC105]|uniref:3-keto-disaccharide hydrolase n=1 Tax=Robiginitalea sp. SC105 TaxID=2762332 RepID=UPI0016396FD3|nr:DUF1080 domain-containing protein [Robiginitalea sp. SC105]MBC2838473.1 DUF1080 domain-containing protein [Robiginitalea sp. SC105]
MKPHALLPKPNRFYLLTLCLLLACSLPLFPQADSPIIGRWDLTVEADGRELPSWLEVKLSGTSTLVGHYVSFAGSARPISRVHAVDSTFSFSLPPQWIGTHDMHVQGRVDGDRISGNLLFHTGTTHAFTGVRAPELLREEPAKWTRPRPLIASSGLEGWTTTPGSGTNQWQVADGVLSSAVSGANLMTVESFGDFKLHVEFRIPEGSNSGIYLRGRYEVQVEDGYGKEPASIYLGGIYGFLSPNEMAARKAGEWQVYDITLVGRRVTVELNGKTIIHRQIIPGITGGALDSAESEPGPIMLQGDHGPVSYRNMTISVPQG